MSQLVLQHCHSMSDSNSLYISAQIGTLGFFIPFFNCNQFKPLFLLISSIKLSFITLIACHNNAPRVACLQPPIFDCCFCSLICVYDVRSVVTQRDWDFSHASDQFDYFILKATPNQLNKSNHSPVEWFKRDQNFFGDTLHILEWNK